MLVIVVCVCMNFAGGDVVEDEISGAQVMLLFFRFCFAMAFTAKTN